MGNLSREQQIQPVDTTQTLRSEREVRGACDSAQRCVHNSSESLTILTTVMSMYMSSGVME
jgi:hypothetical protein